MILGGTNRWGEFHLLERMTYFILLWHGISLPAQIESNVAVSLIKAQISHCCSASFFSVPTLLFHINGLSFSQMLLDCAIFTFAALASQEIEIAARDPAWVGLVISVTSKNLQIMDFGEGNGSFCSYKLGFLTTANVKDWISVMRQGCRVGIHSQRLMMGVVLRGGSWFSSFQCRGGKWCIGQHWIQTSVCLDAGFGLDPMWFLIPAPMYQPWRFFSVTFHERARHSNYLYVRCNFVW